MNVGDAALIICLISFALGLAYTVVNIKLLRYLLYVLTPVIISNILYWGPNFTDINSHPHRSFAPLILSLLIFAGWIGSFLSSNYRIMISPFQRLFFDLKANKGSRYEFLSEKLNNGMKTYKKTIRVFKKEMKK